jgi:hypothetical protein
MPHAEVVQYYDYYQVSTSPITSRSQLLKYGRKENAEVGWGHDKRHIISACIASHLQLVAPASYYRISHFCTFKKYEENQNWDTYYVVYCSTPPQVTDEYASVKFHQKNEIF